MAGAERCCGLAGGARIALAERACQAARELNRTSLLQWQRMLRPDHPD